MIQYVLFKVCLAFPGLKVGFLSSVLRRYHFPITRCSWLKSWQLSPQTLGNTTLAQALALVSLLWTSLRPGPACCSDTAAVTLKEGVSLQKGSVRWWIEGPAYFSASICFLTVLGMWWPCWNEYNDLSWCF